MEEVACVFCGTPSTLTEIEDNGFTGKRCVSCNIIYVSPRPSLAEVTDLYGHDRSGISAEYHIAARHIKQLHARHNLRRLRAFVSSGRLLEIGAAAGYFLAEARDAGFEVYGIELNGLLAGHVREHMGIRCEESPLNGSSFEGKKFDVIYHCDVLSHFFNPIEEFTRIRASLCDKGIVVFETGNFADVDKRFYPLIDSFLYPEHLFFFGERSLAELLRRSGFRLLAIHRSSLVPYYRWRMVEGWLRAKYYRLRHERMPSWLLVKALKKGRTWLRRSRVQREGGAATTAAPDQGGAPAMDKSRIARADRWTLRATNYCTHFIRYAVGRMVPRSGRPQTVLVIAEKV